MLTLTGNGRLTRPVELRTTHSGKSVATVSLASDRRNRDADAIYVDLILWEGQAQAAAEHLVKGQAVAFAGRLEPRPYQTSSGEQRVALEVHGVDLEYGPRPRGHEPNGFTPRDGVPVDTAAASSAPPDDDIPF